jgi:predicted TIM-barrel fold metal-dependent hydrolase
MPPPFRATAPRFSPPPGTTDCHMHIVGPPGRFPLAAGRSYATVEASVDNYRRVMAATGIARAVVVQPSFYGTDNRCTVEALAALGDAARGVAVIDPDISDTELEALNAAGCRGARVNVATSAHGEDQALAERLAAVDAHIFGLGWHLQVFTHPDGMPAVATAQPRLNAPLVVDHFGLLRPELVETQPMRSYLEALERILDGGGWVKLSGLYRVADDFLAPSLTALARRLHDRAPDRVVWASDWPHTPPHGRSPTDNETLLPFRDIDTGQLLSPVASWFPEEDIRRRVLVENPERLYGFINRVG